MAKNSFSHRICLAFCSLILISTASCASNPPTETGQEALLETNYAGKKILWVDSYHQGNPWNDGIERGIRKILDGSEVELRIVHMDTARNTSEGFKQAAGQLALERVQEFEPDVLIASDDNAQKYLVVPYIMNMRLPVVFCGVNWDASIYGYPTTTITGMLEVDPVEPLMRALKDYTRGTQVAYLSGETETQWKVTENYNQRFFDGRMQVHLVKSFDEFKQQFLLIQEQADILITGNYVGIQDWDDAAAQAFIIDNSRIPTGYVDGYMTPLVLITMGKIPEEQGEYAASVALKIIAGAQPSDFPVTTNKQTVLGINLVIAEKLNITFAPSLIKNAEIVYPEQ
ncbi:MAG: ABC transporter substrate binding protein [Chloroflexota bacterium]